MTRQHSAGHLAGVGMNVSLAPVLDVFYKTGNFNLHTIDEVPYPTAISAGVKPVMVSWAIYTALDASLPAGLSPTVIGQELRGRNAFTGVTITDALEAGALNAFGSTGNNAAVNRLPIFRHGLTYHGQTRALVPSISTASAAGRFE